MIAIADVLNKGCHGGVAMPAALHVLAHLSEGSRRDLLRTIALGESSESYLAACYGAGWGSVQADLRALIASGLVRMEERGDRLHFEVNASAFPAGWLQGFLHADAAACEVA